MYRVAQIPQLGEKRIHGAAFCWSACRDVRRGLGRRCAAGPDDRISRETVVLLTRVTVLYAVTPAQLRGDILVFDIDVRRREDVFHGRRADHIATVGGADRGVGESR